MNYLLYIAFGVYLAGVVPRLKALLYAGGLLQAIYLIDRGLELGRIPIVGVHDTLSFFACSLVAFTIPVYSAMRKKSEFFPVIALLSAVFTIFSIASKPHEGYLPPVLKTYWFELHVGLSFFSYALFAIAFALGISYLRHREVATEKLQYKMALTGYCLFSLSMVFGGIWAHLAWGTYWLWTPKELWTTILWLYYSLYLHARLLKGWSGRPAAVLGIVGFAVVMFTYLGVGLLMKSSHAF